MPGRARLRSSRSRLHGHGTFALACLWAGVLAACSSGGGSRGSAADCGLAPADSVFLAEGPVYRGCHVDRQARLLNPNVAIDFRPSRTPQPNSGSLCFRTDLEFVVGPDGRAEAAGARVVQSTDAEYTRAVLASLPAWRYEPALRNGSPVRQIVRERRAVSIAMHRSGPPAPHAAHPAAADGEAPSSHARLPGLVNSA